MVNHKNDIKRLIYENQQVIAGYGAKSLGLFGSFVKDQANAKSDIDLLVEFKPGSKTYDNFINLAYYLEDLFDRKVELVTKSSLSRYIRPHIDKSIEYVSISL